MSNADDIVVRVAHVSDIHFGESVVPRDIDSSFPGRKPHDIQVFTALTHALRHEVSFDLLALSGDLSQQGHPSSFHCIHNWLAQSFIGPNNLRLGLDLDERRIPYIAVPGNHDRFGGGKFGRQRDDREFENQFALSESPVYLNIKGINVVVHLIDSSDADGGYASGYVKPTSCSHFPPTERHQRLDLAVLHHHIIEPPNRAPAHYENIRNNGQALGYLLGAGFDGVFFGHKHYPFFDVIPGRAAARLANGARPGRSFTRAFLRSLLARGRRPRPRDIVSMPLASRCTRSGLWVSMRSIIDYEYLTQFRGLLLKPPAAFELPAKFYRYIESMAGKNPPPSVDDMRNKCRVAVSMAPTAAQAGEVGHGFHVVEFYFRSGRLIDVSADLHQYNGARFVPVKKCVSQSFGREMAVARASGA
jgi:hypothetical protein